MNRSSSCPTNYDEVTLTARIMAFKGRKTIGPKTFTIVVPHLLLAVVLWAALGGGVSWALEKPEKNRFLEDKQSQWEITARKMTYDEEKSLYVAEGDVVISRLGQTLYAQRAIYNQKDGVVEVFGDVRLEAYGDVLTGEHGTFNLREGTGQLTKGRLFLHENHFWVSSDDLKKVGPNTYIAKNCRLTSCDGDRPDWSITASEVEVTVEGYGTMRNAAFRVADVPVFWLPYGRFPAKTERSSGILLPRGGYSHLNGLALELPIFWAISDQQDATFYERGIENRGFMQGLEYRYVAEQNSKGTFLFDILSDKITPKNLQDPEEVNLSPFPRTNKTRYWARGRMDQELPMDILARFDADYVSDQDYLKEFGSDLIGFEVRPDLQKISGRPVEEIRSPTRRSALRLSRDREDYSLQALSTYYERPENPPFDTTPEPLGSFNFALLPRSFAGSPVSLKFDTDYDFIARESGQRGRRFSLNPEITYPVFFGNFLQFEPTMGYSRTMQWLENDPLGINYQSRDAYKLQARFSTVLSRTFPFAWRDVTALKHKITPSITYEYRVPRDQDKFQPWFEPIDVEGKVNTVAFSLENILDSRSETEKGGTRYTQWGTFTLTQPYSIDVARSDEAPSQEREPFEPLQGILKVNPFPGLDLEAQAAWDHEQNDIVSTGVILSLGIERSGGRKDSFYVDYQYTKDGIKSLVYNFHVNLVRGFSVGNALTRDLKAGTTVQSSAWIEYASQCWAVRLTADHLEESGKSFMVYFRLFGFGGT